MVVAWVLYLIYFPLAVVDSGVVDWWTLLGSCFWVAQGALMVWMWRYIRCRSAQRVARRR